MLTIPRTAVSPIQSTGERTESSRPTLADASMEFEALLIQNMLGTARREAAAESLDSGSDAVMELAEQLIAKSLASAGGFGISRLIHPHAQIESWEKSAVSTEPGPPHKSSAVGP
jgi:Rod binding domain-containing protein